MTQKRRLKAHDRRQKRHRSTQAHIHEPKPYYSTTLSTTAIFQKVTSFLPLNDVANLACTSTELSDLAEKTPEYKLGSLYEECEKIKNNLNRHLAAREQTVNLTGSGPIFNSLDDYGFTSMLYDLWTHAIQPCFTKSQCKQGMATQSLIEQLKCLNEEVKKTENKVVPQNKRRSITC